jgi:hypothetical protein
MALDVYFREDILNVLRATYVAGEGSGAVLEALEDQDLSAVPVHKLVGIYRSGFATALGAVGLAFGLSQVVQEAAQQVAVCPSLPSATPVVEPRPRAVLGGSDNACTGNRRPACDHGWSKSGYEKHGR